MLNEQEFRLTSPTADITIGGEGTTPYCLNTFDPGSPQWDVGQESSPYFRAFMFGEDVLRGPVWQWHLTVNGTDFESQRSLIESLSRNWHDEALKRRSGALQRITYRFAGRERFVLGRTREFKHSFDAFQWSGTPDAWLSFQLMSNVYYSTEDQVLRLVARPPTTGGLVAPLVAPLTTERFSDPVGANAVNSGTMPTPLRFAIHGPVTVPVITGPNGAWLLKLNMRLAADQIVYISTMEGATQVVDNFGRNLIGKLGFDSRPSRIQLAPGEHSITYSGDDVTGTSYVDILWNNAYDSL